MKFPILSSFTYLIFLTPLAPAQQIAHSPQEIAASFAVSAPAALATHRWTLHYTQEAHHPVAINTLAARLDDAADFIEREFGPFTSSVRVEVSSTLPSVRPGLTIHSGMGGYAGEIDGSTFVMVRTDVATTNKFRHELLHAWLRQEQIRPARGLEEGLAELIEHSFNHDMYQVLLRENGPIDLQTAALLRTKPGRLERHIRASFWASLSYLRHLHPELSLKQLLTYPDLPDSADSWQWLQEKTANSF